jgi:hypothetical protein
VRGINRGIDRGCGRSAMLRVDEGLAGREIDVDRPCVDNVTSVGRGVAVWVLRQLLVRVAERWRTVAQGLESGM